MAATNFSKTDIFYRKIIRNTFFSQGWGTVDTFRNLQKLKRDLFNAEKFKEMVSMNECVKIDNVREVTTKHNCYSVVDGHFQSPVVKYYPGLLPKESEQARFQAIIPVNHSGARQPMCVQLAGTGDHNYWRRRNLVAKPLLRENSIGSVMLVNPYYGCRKPKAQTRSSLNCVVDLFIMGCALIVETSVLLNWCEYQGFGPLAVTGLSMGGHMASLAATFVPKPIAVVPCLSWTTASQVFTEGVLSKAVAWPVLEEQLENADFVDELQYICHMIEMDGKNARKGSTADANLDSPYSFPQIFLNKSGPIGNMTVQPSLDYQVTFSKNHHISQNCQSVSLTMLAESMKEQLRNNIKHKVPTEIPLFISRKNLNKPRKYERAREFMKYILDITTHLRYYKEPFDPQFAVFVEALYDAYVPRKNCASPEELWPGCQVEYTKCGHIVAALYKQDVFRKIIAKSLNKMP